MKKGIAFTLLLVAVVSARADTTIDDFTVASSDFVMVDNSNAYGSNPSYLGHPFLGERNVSGANYVGDGVDSFVVHAPGNGTLTATGNGSASGDLALTYYEYPSGESDLTHVSGITIDFASSTGPLSLALGAYSNQYAEEAGRGFNLASGYTGSFYVPLNSLIGSLDKGRVDNLFIDIGLGTGQSFTITKIVANTTPEPAAFATVGLGLLWVARRGRGR